MIAIKNKEWESIVQIINLDQPTLTDGLGRKNFSRHLLELITRIDPTHGAVVGLEGSWGSGKTNVLDDLPRMAADIDTDKRPEFVKFNPWMVSGTGGLVEAMLLQLASDVERTGGDGDLAVKILTYVEVLSIAKYLAPAADLVFTGGSVSAAAAGFGPIAEVAKALKKLFNRKEQKKVSLQASKTAVIEALERRTKSIVVIVDDMDRLPPQDVAAMVQAVKAVANFPKVVYVLAYDPVITAQALEAAVQVTDGLTYLEKIVQLQVRLPDVPVSKFNAHARARLSPLLPLKDLGEHEAQDLEKAFGLVFPLFRTPRDIERLRSRLQMAVPILMGHVNLADVILLETLDIVQPALVKWIDQHIFVLMKPGFSQYTPEIDAQGIFYPSYSTSGFKLGDREERNAQVLASWDSAIAGSYNRHTIEAALGFLFEACRSKRIKVERSPQRNIQDYRFWNKWRCYHDHNERFTVPELQMYAMHPDRLLTDGIANDESAFMDFVVHICDLKEKAIIATDAVGLVKFFAKAAEAIDWLSVEHRSFVATPTQALKFCIDTDVAGRTEALNVAVDALSVWASGNLLTQYIQDQKLSEEEKKAMDPVLERWAAKAEELLRYEAWDESKSDLSPYHLLVLFAGLRLHTRAARLAWDFLENNSKRLESMYRNFADSPRYETFPMSVEWTVIPPLGELLNLIDSSNTFKSSHSTFVASLQKRAKEEAKYFGATNAAL